ncbi:MAG: hypothetical protein ACPG5T_07610 [Endozoicomonas sp.]
MQPFPSRTQNKARFRRVIADRADLGQAFLKNDPTALLEAATKRYVDDSTPFKNYFGDGSDGDLDTVGDVTYTIAQDAGPVIKQYNNVIINAGHTVTTNNRCKGLIVYVAGNLTINGTVSMTGKGASAVGADVDIKRYGEGIQVGDDAVVSTEASQVAVDLVTYRFPASGASGGVGVSGVAGNNGSAGTDGQTGGGGSGGGGSLGGGTSGAGAAGTSFSGGSGGGAWSSNGAGGTAGSGGSDGGAGGNALGSGGSYAAGGGAGNDGGTGLGTIAEDGDDGTGGLILFLVKGTVSIWATGVIEADGADGGGVTSVGSAENAGGGGSGGGAIRILHGSSYTNSGTVRVNGGAGGSGNGITAGGNGGAGSIITSQISDKVA